MMDKICGVVKSYRTKNMSNKRKKNCKNFSDANYHSDANYCSDANYF